MSEANTTTASEQAPRLKFDGWLLFGHALLMFLYSAANLSWLVAVLAREEFAASDWQTTAITAAIPTLLLSSIFWNAFLQRVSLWKYLSVLWVVGGVPYLAVALADNFSLLFIAHIFWSVGHAGWIPLSGKLLKWFYSDHIHGRIFSFLMGVGLVAGILASYWVGHWLDDNPAAFRWVFPVAGGMQFVGFAVILLVVGRVSAMPSGAIPPLRRVVLDPVLQVVSILKRDRTFLRYELAFMTYGAAFMICDALLPVLVTDRLNLPYDSFSQSTMMVRNLCMLAAVWPWGVFLDRVGAVRMSALAFGALAGYPLLLLIATNEWGLGVANVAFGLGIAGIALTWTLGPVSFAPTHELVSKYTAIHAMCVGIRGLIFQTLGMGLYLLSGTFTLPLLIAAAAFLWGARQMWRLHRDVNRVKIGDVEPPAEAVDPESDADATPARATV